MLTVAAGKFAATTHNDKKRHRESHFLTNWQVTVFIHLLILTFVLFLQNSHRCHLYGFEGSFFSSSRSVLVHRSVTAKVTAYIHKIQSDFCKPLYSFLQALGHMQVNKTQSEAFFENNSYAHEAKSSKSHREAGKFTSIIFDVTSEGKINCLLQENEKTWSD